MSLRPFIERAKTPLGEDDMGAAMRLMMDGAAPTEDIVAFLSELHNRGETVDELVGSAKVLRERAKTITAHPDAIDCCGTGGDGRHTYNISTATALIAAGCGVKVAKHGNRASSSKSGAADVLEALGVHTDLPSAQAELALRECNFTFLFAPSYHSAMKHVASARKSLGHRTIFNLLGPLANPAGTKRQLIGVFDGRWTKPMAEALQRLGTERAWIVHGRDGLDEISVCAPTDIALLENSRVTLMSLDPATLDIPLRRPEELTGGDAAYNARALQRLLDGTPSAYRDISILNAAAVLVISDVAADLREGFFIAVESVDSGAAAAVLDRYRTFSKKVEA